MNTRRQKATASADRIRFPPLSLPSRVTIATRLLTVALERGFAAGLPNHERRRASLRSGNFGRCESILRMISSWATKPRCGGERALLLNGRNCRCRKKDVSDGPIGEQLPPKTLGQKYLSFL